MKNFKLKFTRTITSEPEIVELIATSRENARTRFYGMNPTFYVISVVESQESKEYNYVRTIKK